MTRSPIFVARSVNVSTDPVYADGLPVVVWKLDGLERTSVASALGLGALPNVVTLDKLVDGREWAGKSVVLLDQVTRFGGAPVSGQHTRIVVADDFLDTGRGNNHSVDSPNATVFEIGLGKERTIGGEKLCSGGMVGFVIVEPGMLGTVRDQGTDERVGFGRARDGVGSGVGGAGDVTELGVEGLTVGKPTNHAR